MVVWCEGRKRVGLCEGWRVGLSEVEWGWWCEVVYGGEDVW